MGSVRAGTCGTFDYHIHEDHIMTLSHCRSFCDHLVVYVVGDETVVANKGRRPFYNQTERSRNLLSTGLVDEVVLLEGDFGATMRQVLSSTIDLYILGKDQNGNSWTRQLTQALVSQGVAVLSLNTPWTVSTTVLLAGDGLLDKLRID